MDIAYLPEGLPIPVADADGLMEPYFQGLMREVLAVQQCPHCRTFQFPAGWICHACHSPGVGWVEIAPRGRIYSWTRSWNAVHPVLKDIGPYLVVVIELEDAGGMRAVGNLLGDPRAEVRIGEPVVGRFEHHPTAEPPYSLLQWSRPDAAQSVGPVMS